MLSSSNIIKGPGKNNDCRILELRHNFIEEAVNPNPEPEIEKAEEDFDPVQAAAQILEEAGESARRIVSEAEKTALQIKENTLKIAGEEAERIKNQSREEGYAEGRKEALAKAASDASAIRDQARLVLRQAEEIRRRNIEAFEAEIVSLAIEIAEKVISANLEVDPQIVANIAGEAIGMLHNRDQVVLYVNPDQVSIFQERRDQLMKLISPKGELHILADPDVGPGGCVAETEYGRVDASLGQRWGNLLRALEDYCLEQ